MAHLAAQPDEIHFLLAANHQFVKIVDSNFVDPPDHMPLTDPAESSLTGVADLWWLG